MPFKRQARRRNFAQRIERQGWRRLYDRYASYWRGVGDSPFVAVHGMVALAQYAGTLPGCPVTMRVPRTLSATTFPSTRVAY